jgi:hypothetical protein
MFWNYYLLVNILITILFFFNNKLYFKYYLIPAGFLFYLNFVYKDNLDMLNYYSLDLIYLLPSYLLSINIIENTNYFSFFKFSPYVNVFSEASSIELITRNILLYLKINSVNITLIPFIFFIFYTYALCRFLDCFKLNKKIYFIIIITIMLSKVSLYQGFYAYRLYLGLGFVLFVLSFYFKNYSSPNQAIKTNFLLLFSLLFHVSLMIFILVFNLYLVIKKIRNKKFFFNTIIVILFYFSFFLIYNQYISEILFKNLPAGKYVLSKISWFGVNFTGSNSHLLYYVINPLIVGIIVSMINFLDLEKKKNQLELFAISSLLLMILFSNNTFIWKRMFYMFFPFYVLIFYIYYDKILAKINLYKFFSKIDLSFLLILNIFSLQSLSNFLNLNTNGFYFFYIMMTIIVLKTINNSVVQKNYNILLFIPYLNISYLSILSLSFIELYK